MHIGGDRFRPHQLVHRAHRFRCAGHRTAERNVGAHVLVLVADAADFAVGRKCAGFLLAHLDQLLGEQRAGVLVAGLGVLADLLGLLWGNAVVDRSYVESAANKNCVLTIFRSSSSSFRRSRSMSRPALRSVLSFSRCCSANCELR